MSQMTAAGAAWLAGTLKSSASLTGTYSRGALSVPLQMTLGGSLLATQDGLGNTKVERTDRDFLFTAQDLVAGGISLPPQLGDRITVTPGETTEVYELLPYGRNEPLYRYEDPFETIVRVHGKYRGGS